MDVRWASLLFRDIESLHKKGHNRPRECMEVLNKQPIIEVAKLSASSVSVWPLDTAKTVNVVIRCEEIFA
jgi:hypothetical protein